MIQLQLLGRCPASAGSRGLRNCRKWEVHPATLPGSGLAHEPLSFTPPVYLLRIPPIQQAYIYITITLRTASLCMLTMLSILDCLSTLDTAVCSTSAHFRHNLYLTTHVCYKGQISYRPGLQTRVCKLIARAKVRAKDWAWSR